MAAISGASPFAAMRTAGSALRLYRTWIDAVSDNVANVDTVRSTTDEAFQPRSVVAAATDDGVEVAGIELGSIEGKVVYSPGHPLADANGMVRYPDTDLGDQMVQLMAAQRGYQANISVVQRARDAYRAALEIGRA